MNYSYVIHQVLENIGAERHDSNKIISIKHDIESTIRDLFTNAESPIKSESFTLTEYDDDSIASTIVPISLVPATPAYTYTSVIKSMNQLTIVAANVSATPPAATNSTLNVTITSAAGVELLNQDMTILAAATLTETIDLLFTDIVGATMVLTVSSFGADVASVSISSVSWTKSFNSLQLPEYMYVPFDAHFKVSDQAKGANYMSREATEEEYNRWNPFGADQQDNVSDVLIFDGSPGTATYTLENLVFDHRVGYFFSVIDDRVYLIFKPAVAGTVTVRFSYIPTLDAEPENTVPLHQAFINALVDGTTVRQFNKKIMEADSELELMKIRSSISRYEPPYKLAITRFAGYNRKKSEVHQIKMFGIVSDTSMELQGISGIY
jgi:hypothetical protein